MPLLRELKTVIDFGENKLTLNNNKPLRLTVLPFGHVSIDMGKRESSYICHYSQEVVAYFRRYHTIQLSVKNIGSSSQSAAAQCPAPPQSQPHFLMDDQDHQWSFMQAPAFYRQKSKQTFEKK